MKTHLFRYFLISIIGILLALIVFYLFRLSQPKEIAFRKHLSSNDVNRTIELYRNPFTEYPFKLHHFINLGLRNKSKEIVAFSAVDLGIHLFIYKDGDWSEIDNNVQNLFPFKTGDNVYSSRKPLPTDYYFLAPRAMDFEGVVSNGFLVLNAIPLLDPSDLPTTLRFMVIGTIYRDGQLTNEHVIAHLDIRVVR